MARSEAAGVPTDEWLEACRRMVAAQQELYGRTSGIAARTEYAGIGEGGDRSLVIDRQAEEIVFAELERLHAAGGEFTAISEERGEVVFGDGWAPDRVVIDPIDGSLNARRTIPSFALSIAVASGDLDGRRRASATSGTSAPARSSSPSAGAERGSTARRCSRAARATGWRSSDSRRRSRS